MRTLRIYEIDYSCSPNGTNQFEIYQDIDSSDGNGNMPIYITDSLLEACNLCYALSVNFNVYLLKQYGVSEPAPLVRV
jgi:hypothetical protein